MRVNNAPASARAKPCGTLGHCTIDEDQHRTYAHHRAANPRVTRSVIRVSRHRLGGRDRMTDETPVIPELNRRMLLRGGLVAGAGLAVAGLGTVGLTGVAEAATPDVSFQTQFDWAYCANCAGLWYTNNNTTGACTYARYNYGSGGHVKVPS